MQNEVGFRNDVSIAAEDIIHAGHGADILAGRLGDAEAWVKDTADAYQITEGEVVDRLLREVREQVEQQS
jgi:hypothetical protein